MAYFFFIGLIWVIVIPVSLGQTFEPRLQWICQPSSIFLAVKTEEPFQGIIHATGYRSTCFTAENGTTLSTLVIPIGDQNNTCGVQFDDKTQTYWVEIEVHEYNVIIVASDPVFNVTCSTRSIPHLPTLEFFLEISPLDMNDNSPLQIIGNNRTPKTPHKTIDNGKTFILDGFMASFEDEIKYSNRFRMSNCIVKNVDSSDIEIIDSNGCPSDPNYVTEIVYRDGWASANLSYINPYLTMIKMECKFLICGEKEVCRPSCDRHWYDSAVKRGKDFANWLSSFIDDSPPPATTAPPLINDTQSTIVHIIVPLQTDILPPISNNFFIEKCPIIDFYFFTFEKCHSLDDIFWLYIIAGVGWLLLFFTALWNFFCCCKKCKAAENESDDGDAEDPYWNFEKFPDDKLKVDFDEEEPEEEEKTKMSLFRRLSKRRRASAKSDEIYATIKSRASSTNRIKIAPSLSQHIYENPYITSPVNQLSAADLIKHPPKNGCSIEENPAYICQKLSTKKECGSFF